MGLPGLMCWLPAIQPPSAPTLLGKTPAARDKRLPTCVRSGPSVPAADVPRTVWHWAQTCWNTRSPWRSVVPAGAAGCACALSQLWKASGAMACTSNFMLACCAPQYSAHCPVYLPASSARTRRRLTWPGIMSSLPPSSGIQKLWMTLSDFSTNSTHSPAGMRMSLAVSNTGLPDASR
ncbi:hypothetical protein D3C85_784560 [compost metagenome]